MWYLHKMRDGYCEVNRSPQWPDAVQTWGPFTSEDEAIAKRAELTQQGICLPMN
jgi:hypothetical protein